MKKLLYIIFFTIILLTTIRTVAQDTIPNKEIAFFLEKNIGIVFSSKYSSASNQIGNSINGLMTYKIGINSLLFLHKKNTLFLLTEAGYITNGWILKDISNTNNIINAQGNVDLNNITSYDLFSKNHYLYLSAKVGKGIYNFSKKAILYTALGIQGQYLYSSISSSEGFIINGRKDEFKITYNGSKISQHYGMTLVGGVGLLTNISKKISFMIFPYLSYDINATKIKEAAADRKYQFYNVGVDFNLLYHF